MSCRKKISKGYFLLLLMQWAPFAPEVTRLRKIKRKICIEVLEMAGIVITREKTKAKRDS